MALPTSPCGSEQLYTLSGDSGFKVRRGTEVKMAWLVQIILFFKRADANLFSSFLSQETSVTLSS